MNPDPYAPTRETAPVDHFGTRLEEVMDTLSKLNMQLENLEATLIYQVGIARVLKAAHLQQLVMVRDTAEAKMHFHAMWNLITEVERRTCQVETGALNRENPFA